MSRQLNARQLTGRTDSHVVALPCGNRLQAAAARAFSLLQMDAREAGFELAVASGFRSYDRQLAIWNGKARGQRPVHDDAGREVKLAELDLLRAVGASLDCPIPPLVAYAFCPVSTHSSVVLS